MFNVAQQFGMQAPTLKTLASDLLRNPRGVSQPIPVAKSAAPVAFFGNARGYIAQAPAWYLGTGNGLSGMGNPRAGRRVVSGGLNGFGALSGDVVIPGITFNHVWSMEDLTGSSQRAQNWMSEVSGGPRGLEYPPQDFGFRFVSTGLLASAKAGWAKLNEYAAAGNGPASDAVQSINAELQSAAREVDNTWDGVRFGIASRAPDIEARRTNALKTIAKDLALIVERAQVLQQAEAAKAAKAAQDFATGAAAGPAPGAAVTPAANAAPAAATAAPTTNPYLVPGLVFGGLAVVGIGIYLMRR
jgi:hypothetical protein